MSTAAVGAIATVTLTMAGAAGDIAQVGSAR